MSRSSPNAALRFAARGGEGIGQPCGVADDVHPLAAAARRGLDEERVADPCRRLHQGLVRLVRAVVPRQHRNAKPFGQDPRRGLVAHRADRSRWRTDPTHPGGHHGFRELSVLGEESEARMDGVGPSGASGLDHGGDIEEVDGVRTLGRGRDGADPEALAGSPDADLDLAAIGDEQRADVGPESTAPRARACCRRRRAS